MCGIIAAALHKTCVKDLIYGLKALEYRGYDSCGIIFSDFEQYKTLESINFLETITANASQNTGIAHTRWATHGQVNLTNTHPVKIGNFAIVHNGILENANSLQSLINYKPKTKTDTEILLAYIKYIFEKSDHNIECLKEVLSNCQGSFAAAFMIHDSNKSNANTSDKNKIYWIKKGISPLICAKNENGFFITSDVEALSQSSEIFEINEDGFGFITSDTIYSNIKLDQKFISIKKEMKHDIKTTFFEKEMLEQIEILKKAKNHNIEFQNFDQILLIGCGSAYFACEFAAKILEEQGINAKALIASEWNCIKSTHKNDLAVFVSQSGETADTISALNKAKTLNLKTAALVNKEQSLLAKQTDFQIFLGIGSEKSVASTKAFTSMLYNFFKLIKPNYDFNLNTENTVNLNLKNLAYKINESKQTLIIGKHVYHTMAQEGSLKIKELTYKPIEPYAAGELKHGYIALIDNQTYVFTLAFHDAEHEPLYHKTLSNAQEAQARGASIILLTNKKCDIDFHETIEFDCNYYEGCFHVSIFFQKLAFEIATLKNLNIDKPRNLAKAVTVE